MKPDRTVVLVYLAGLAAIVLLCSDPSLTGGDATETGNARIAGRVVDSLGVGVQGVHVNLLPVDYNPVRDGTPSDSLAAATDDSGSFTITSPTEGIYNIEVIQYTTGGRAFVSNISAFGHDTVFASVATIQKPGTIKALLPSCFDTAAGYVYLPGTTRFGRISDGVAIIDSVPAGSFTALEYVNQADTMRSVTLKTDFTVTSALTTFISENHAWGFSRKLSINTTSSGAAVSGNVFSFPVLVRLSADNFVFSQAKSKGEDIRFVKADGSLLPFEIERWDAVTELAEVWVKVDTVYGNDSTYYFTMLWGDSLSTGTSKSEAVFDTANGFQGVWHLSEPQTAVAKDATGNHYDGTPSDTAPTVAEGMIGPCKSFNGSSNFLCMNGTAGSKLNFKENGTYTISAWACVDTLDNESHLIVGKGNEQYYLKFKSSIPEDTSMVWEFVEYHDKAGWYITNSLPVLPSVKTWVYVTGVRKGAAQYFYVNGTLVDSAISVTAATVARQTGEEVSIGRFLSEPVDSVEGTCPFFGKIDEVRIATTAVSADWIKLCYMNQKRQDALVKW